MSEHSLYLGLPVNHKPSTAKLTGNNHTTFEAVPTRVARAYLPIFVHANLGNIHGCSAGSGFLGLPSIGPRRSSSDATSITIMTAPLTAVMPADHSSQMTSPRRIRFAMTATDILQIHAQVSESLSLPHSSYFLLQSTLGCSTRLESDSDEH